MPLQRLIKELLIEWLGDMDCLLDKAKDGYIKDSVEQRLRVTRTSGIKPSQEGSLRKVDHRARIFPKVLAVVRYGVFHPIVAAHPFLNFIYLFLLSGVPTVVNILHFTRHWKLMKLCLPYCNG